MNDFFRFLHTPHLLWLGEGDPRDDKVLSRAEAEALLADSVVVDEKLDGANVGLFSAPDGSVLAQNRGQYLTENYTGQFARLSGWLAQHGTALQGVLTQELIVFGEWCAARHSLDYTELPDWSLLFDVYDRSAAQFWSTPRRNCLAGEAGLVTVPQLQQGRTTQSALRQLVADTPSRYREGPLEGLVIRRESSDWCEARAKLVRAEFTQAIDTHWRKRAIEWNSIRSDR